MAVTTGIRFVKMDVRAIPSDLTPVVKNMNASVDPKTARATNAPIACQEGVMCMKSWKSITRKTGIKNRVPKKFCTRIIVKEEYFVASFFKKTTFINAEKTAKNSQKRPTGEAVNLKSASRTITKTPAKEMMNPKMFIMETLSLKAT